MRAASNAKPATTSVLFIGGQGRSGSTLLSRLLGQHPSVMSVGELIFIGDRGFQDNQLCGCGEPFRECHFWTEVISQVAGPSPDKWFARLIHLRETVGRRKHFPMLALRRYQGKYVPSASPNPEYAGMLGDLMSAISTVSGVGIIVDSSKEPVYGFHLGRSKLIDLYPAHLVRDSRAVAFSLQRVRVRPEIHWKTEMMPRVSPARSAFDWNMINSLMHVLGSTSGKYYRVRYEDIVENPQGSSSALLHWIGADDATPTPHSAGGEHELSGNPMRFQREFNVVPDREWFDNMSAHDYAVTTALSAPLLAHYGYKLGKHKCQQ